VIMASRTYGTATNSLFDTGRERNFILGQRKPLCLVRMIPFGEAWAEASTTLAFPDSIKQKLWMPGERMPDDLVEMVQEKLVTVSPSFAQRTRSIVRRDDAAASSTVAELQKQSSAKEKAAAEAEEAKAAAAAEAELSELSSASEPPDEPADVFISFRFAEAEAEARALKSALEHAGVSVFLSGVSLGDDHAISQALASCRLADRMRIGPDHDHRPRPPRPCHDRPSPTAHRARPTDRPTLVAPRDVELQIDQGDWAAPQLLLHHFHEVIRHPLAWHPQLLLDGVREGQRCRRLRPCLVEWDHTNKAQWLTLAQYEVTLPSSVK